MRLPQTYAVTLAVAATLALTSCGAMRESRLNPFNWFGKSHAQKADEFAVATPTDARPLVDQVLSMVIEKTPTGAIVRATGLPPTQGYYNAELVARPVDDKGVLVYDFRLMPPPEPQPAGSPQTREVTVAAYLTHIALENVREIVVQGASNARSSRR